MVIVRRKFGRVMVSKEKLCGDRTKEATAFGPQLSLMQKLEAYTSCKTATVELR